MKEIKEMYPSWGDDHGVRLGNVKISDLHDFKEHPFHVVEDTALFELAKSIEDKGVLVPLIVRANPYGDGYEIIAGHRRKAACKWAGLSEVSVMVVEMDEPSEPIKIPKTDTAPIIAGTNRCGSIMERFCATRFLFMV